MTEPADLPFAPTELATFVAAKLCHDFITPAGAIIQGLDLINDPESQDMRDDALNLIGQSANKLVAIVQFARVAFGAATSAESFSGEALRQLVEDMIKGGRATMDWAVTEPTFDKPAARTLLNLAYLTVGALPSGGQAVITAERTAERLVLKGVAEGARARLKPEAAVGLAGERLTDGLVGQWVQPYWLWLNALDAGGRLDVEVEEGRVVLTAVLPG
jgi:histidine phosphotransferase ChpT